MEITQEQARADTVQRARGRPKRTNRKRLLQDGAARILLSLLALAIGVLLLALGITLLLRSLPILRSSSVWTLLTSTTWMPHQGQFGYANFIVGTLSVTAVAMLIAVVPAVLSGVYLAEYTSARARLFIRPMLDVLVGLPPVVYGLWGVLAVVPLIREFAGPSIGALALPWLAFTNPSGYSVLAAGIVLAIMVYPLIVAVVAEVMRSAPDALREALLSLGATRWETTRTILLHRGLGGILAAIVLGFSRALGETLAVLMVVGNVVQFPASIFDSAYTLPALIANNYGEMMSIPLYESALMGAALLLLVVVVCFNIVARAVIVRVERSA